METGRFFGRRWRLLAVSAIALLAALAVVGPAAASDDEGHVPPSISSDKADYAPGELVTLRGSDWAPGERVTVDVNDDQGETWRRNVEVTADESGRIVDSFNLPNWFVATYAVVATGATSGVAHAAFTDSNPQAILVAPPVSVTVAQGSTANYGLLTMEVGGNEDACNTTFGVVAGGGTGLPSGTTPQWGTNPVTTTGSQGGHATTSFSVATGLTTPVGTYTFRVAGTNGGGGCQGPGPTNSDLLTLVVTAGTFNTTTSAANASATYGDASVTLSATVTPASGPAVNSGTVTFTVNGTPVTSGTVSGGAASASFPLAGVNAGEYAIAATYNPGAGFNGSNNSAQTPAPKLTVSPRAVTITPDSGQSKTYGAGDPALTFTHAPALVSGDSFSGALGRAPGENVGTYAITLGTLSAGSNYTLALSAPAVTFEIVKKLASVTPDAAGKVYGAADPALTGTLSGFLAADGVTATYTRAAGETVGGSPYLISATLAPAGVLSNYDITYNTANFSITAKAASVTPDAASKVYGAADPALTGTLVGFLAGDNVTATYTRAAGETVLGGPYTISATLAPAGVLSNYDITYNTANFTITPKAASVTPAPKTKVYGAADPVLTGTLSGFLEADDVTASYSRTSGETVAGSPYTISATLSPAGVLSNYDVTSNTAAFTITPKELLVNAVAASKVYGDADPAFGSTLSGFANDEDAEDAGVTGAASCTRASGESVPGSPYAITCAPGTLAADNYSFATGATANFTITKRELSVNAVDASKTYGDADPAFTWTLDGFAFGQNTATGGVTGSAACSRESGEAVPGPYAITCAPGTLAADNYSFAAGDPAELTIGPKAASVTPNAASKVYGDDDPAFTGTLAGFLSGDNVTATYTRTSGEAVGGSPYTISATLEPAAVLGNYDITYNTADFTITPKELLVNAVAASKVYGNADPAFEYTLSGFAFDDDAEDAGVTGAASCSRSAGEAVLGSPYTITCAPGTLAAANYSFATGATANFDIDPKAASVTPNGATKVYGDADPAFTGTLDGFLAADGVTASYTRESGQAVGSYTISATLSPESVLSNYDITYNTAELEITPKELLVHAVNASKVYGQADPTFTWTLAGFAFSENATTAGVTGAADCSREAGESVAGGPYEITCEPGTLAAANYSFATGDSADLTITAKAASVTPAAASKVYGQADPVFGGSLVGFHEADGVTATYSRTAGETVAGSPYTISATLSPAEVLSNYDITYNTAEFTIEKRPASVTPDAASKVYGDDDPALTGTLHNFVEGDGVTATYTRTAGENVAGSPYTISATLAPVDVLDNYTVTYHTAEFTIEQKAASVTPDAKSKTYGNVDPVLTGTLTGFLPADGVTATYSRTAGETVAGGPYTISATLSPAGVLGNYDITSNTASFTIDPRPVTVKANDVTRVYGASTPAFSIVLHDGTLGFSDTLASLGTPAYSFASGEGVNVGSYRINVSGLSNANYDISYATGDDRGLLTITPKAASVTPDAKSKVYGADDPALTGTLAGFLESDGVTAAYSRTAGETVAGSPYTISATLSATGLLSNYDIASNTASFTITPKAASVTPDAKSKVYGDDDPELTGTLSGFLAADGVTATYSRTAGETVLGGPYTISATLAPAGVLGNYTITSNTANFTITKRPLTVTADPKSKAFGAPDPPLTWQLTSGDLVGSDAITGSLTRVAGEAVGSYAIQQGSLTAGPNYLITFVGASLTIGAWHATGFYQPIGIPNSIFVVAPGSAPSANPGTPWNTAKGGSTVPLKFNLYTSNGGTERTSTGDIASFTAVKLNACTSAPEDAIEEFTTTGSTSLRYDTTDRQFIQNWKTPAVKSDECYRAGVRFTDGSGIYAFFKLRK